MEALEKMEDIILEVGRYVYYFTITTYYFGLF